MKKRYKALLLLVTAGIILFCIVVFILVPKAAAITLPYRWGNIPLHQHRSLVRQYLGIPTDTTIANTDKWAARRENGAYILSVAYNGDTTATSYTIYFNYHLGFFKKSFLLVEK